MEVLNNIKFELIDQKNNKNASILEELAFIEKNDFDFCDNIEPELEQYINELALCFSIHETSINAFEKLSQYENDLQKLRQ